MSHDGISELMEPLARRAQVRYPALPTGPLAHAAALTVAKRPVSELQDRLIAGHIAVARLAGAQLSRSDEDGLLAAPAAVGAGESADLALAEHVDARLTVDESLVIALRATCGLAPARAAQALNLTRNELRRVEDQARQHAAALTLAYHEQLICEPAALSSAESPTAGAAAVTAHLSTCRSCRREFERRVSEVLSHAGALRLPLPPLAVPARRSLSLLSLRGRTTFAS